jgi:uroporphyrinogen-III synthase
MTAVLITRPVVAAVHLAEKLHKLGYAPLVEPLLTIVPSGEPRPAAKSLRAVIITSRNALAALVLRRKEIADLLTLPCYCVGPRTAEAARVFGFQHVKFSHGDGVDLARLVQKEAKAKALLLHVAGEETSLAMTGLLKEAGFRVSAWSVYKAQAAGALSLALQQKLVERKVDSVLFFSPRTASHFVRLIQQHELEACCADLSAIGLSPAVIAALEPLTWRHALAVTVPTEDAMVACLQRTCPVS